MKKILLTFFSALLLFTSFYGSTDRSASASELNNDNGREYVVIKKNFNSFPPTTYFYNRGDKRGTLNRSYYDYSNGIWYTTYTGYIFYNAPIQSVIKQPLPLSAFD